VCYTKSSDTKSVALAILRRDSRFQRTSCVFLGVWGALLNRLVRVGEINLPRASHE
jgi:hypothetical protein